MLSASSLSLNTESPPFPSRSWVAPAKLLGLIAALPIAAIGCRANPEVTASPEPPATQSLNERAATTTLRALASATSVAIMTVTDTPLVAVSSLPQEGEYIGILTDDGIAIHDLQGRNLGRISDLTGTGASLNPQGTMLQIDAPGFSLVDLATGDVDKDGCAQGGSWGSWAPDGTMIAFISGYEPGRLPMLSVLDVSTQTCLPILGWFDLEAAPSWSPDGRWIAFSSKHGRANLLAASDIFILDTKCLQNTEDCPAMTRQVTHTAEFDGVDSPSWSPDSLRMAFICGIPESPSVCVGDATTGEIDRIHSGAVPPFEPHWSPSGEWIAYTENSSIPPGTAVYIVRPDGTDRTLIADAGWMAFWVVSD